MSKPNILARRLPLARLDSVKALNAGRDLALRCEMCDVGEPIPASRYCARCHQRCQTQTSVGVIRDSFDRLER